MKNIVLLGGNGYIGRAVTEEWLQRDKEINFYVISRSGENKLKHAQIINLRADVTKHEEIRNILPATIDCIVDFIGRPEKDTNELIKNNQLPAEVMLSLATELNVATIGFIGGTLGPSSFVRIKKDILNMLKTSGKKVVYVEPTLVYGKDRTDNMAKMAPLLKVFGLFKKSLRPVRVEDLAKEFIDKLTN